MIVPVPVEDKYIVEIGVPFVKVAGGETLAHVGPLAAAASTLGKITLLVVEPLSSVAVKITVVG